MACCRAHASMNLITHTRAHTHTLKGITRFRVGGQHKRRREGGEGGGRHSCATFPKQGQLFHLLTSPLYLNKMQQPYFCSKSGILRSCVQPGAYFAPTLAGQKVS